MGHIWKGIKNIAWNFSAWTSIHALPHVGLSNVKLLQLLWALIFSGASFAFLYQLIFQLIKQYFEYPVNVDTAIQYGQRVFPSVTFCFLNPWKVSQIGSTPLANMINAYASNNASISSTYGFTTPATFQNTQRAAKWTQLMSEVLEAQDSSNDSSMSYSYEDLFISCTYNQGTCNGTDFASFYDPFYGKCYTFNNEGIYNSSRASPAYGLRVVMRVNRADILPWITSVGVALYIHPAGQNPFVDTRGYYVPVGRGSSLGVQYLSRVKLPHPYSTCTEKGAGQPNYYEGGYDVESCLRSCIQGRIIKQCGCYDPSYAKPTGGTAISCYDMSNVNTAIDCIMSITNTDGTFGFNVNKECSCPEGCTTDSYHVTMSKAAWPANSYTPPECIQSSNYSSNWENNNNGGNVGWGNGWNWLWGPPTTTQAPQTTTGPPNTQVLDNCRTWYKMNTLLVEIYYEIMDWEVDTETVAYNLLSLISDIGGQISLWLGMSIISMLEICVFFFLICFYLCVPRETKEQIGFDYNDPDYGPDAAEMPSQKASTASLYHDDDKNVLPPHVQSPR